MNIVVDKIHCWVQTVFISRLRRLREITIRINPENWKGWVLFNELADRPWNPTRKSRNKLAPPYLLHSDSWKNESTALEVLRAGMNVTSTEGITESMNPALCGMVTETHFIHFQSIQRGRGKKRKKYSIGRCFLFSVFSKQSGQLDTVASLGPHKPSLCCGWWTIGSQMWKLASMYFFYCIPCIQDLDFLWLLTLLGRRNLQASV